SQTDAGLDSWLYAGRAVSDRDRANHRSSKRSESAWHCSWGIRRFREPNDRAQVLRAFRRFGFHPPTGPRRGKQPIGDPPFSFLLQPPTSVTTRHQKLLPFPSRCIALPAGSGRVGRGPLIPITKHIDKADGDG